MLLKRAQASWPLMLAVQAMGGCTCGGTHDTDAGGPSRDAAVSLDAIAPSPDAAPDAEVPLDPGWMPMPGLPDGCTIERA